MLSADLDLDGRADIAMTYNGFVSVWLSSSMLSPGNVADYTVFGDGVTSEASADFNGDGYPDLAVANGSLQAVQVMFNLGPGIQSGLFSGFGERFPASAIPTAMVAPDLNGDGHPDVVVTDKASGVVNVLLGKAGAGIFGATVSYAVGAAPMGMATADFNGDGRPDIAVTNGGSGSMSVLFGNGDGTLSPPITFVTGTSPAGIVAPDLNGDGAPDIVVANTGSGTVSVFLNSGNGSFAPQVSYSSPSASTLAIGDLNGDGHPDLAVGTGPGKGDIVSLYFNDGKGKLNAIAAVPVLNLASFAIDNFIGSNAIATATYSAPSSVVELLSSPQPFCPAL
jgi:hypothetical protein